MGDPSSNLNSLCDAGTLSAMQEPNVDQKCEKCGALVQGNPEDPGRTGQCSGCGAPIRVTTSFPCPPPLPPPVQGVVQTSGYAVASLVLGILSIFPGVYLGGLIMGILAIVFSRMAMSRITAQPRLVNGQGLATAGLVTGIVGLSISALIILFFGAMVGVGLAFMAAIFKAMLAGMPR